jgi:putative ABC transport system substrate-binding protein
MRRSGIGLILTLALGLLLLPFTAETQQAGKVYRVGVFSNPSSGGRLETFRQGMRELGYVEGQNLAIEQRFSEGREEVDQAAIAELVQRKVDVLVTSGTAPTRAAKSVTSTIPVVMTFVSDPVGQGFVNSLGRPGRNITGLATLGPEVSTKWLELLKEMVPKVSRVGVLFNPTVQAHRLLVTEMEGAAHASGVALHLVEALPTSDVEVPLATLQKQSLNALIVLLGSATTNQKRILEFAAVQRLPAVYWWREYVDAGGLMYYGPSVDEMYRRAASYVDKILKGAKPADLPVEQPMKFELILNLKTAKALGLAIPPTLLFQADEVIR